VRKRTPLLYLVSSDGKAQNCVAYLLYSAPTSV
jgi:hypothetical protein